MDFKDLIGKLDQLNEAEMTSRKVAGKAYGGSAQDDDEDDEDGEKKSAAPAEKRGRGRPRKAGGDAQVKAGYGGAAELQKYIVGSVPKKSKELEKLGKTKHKLSDKEPKESKKINEDMFDVVNNLIKFGGINPGLSKDAFLDELYGQIDAEYGNRMAEQLFNKTNDSTWNEWYSKYKRPGMGESKKINEDMFDVVNNLIKFGGINPGLSKDAFLDELYGQIDAEYGNRMAEQLFNKTNDSTWNEWYSKYKRPGMGESKKVKESLKDWIAELDQLMESEVQEVAKWRQGYRASGHPAGFKHASGEVGPLGGTYDIIDKAYDATEKVPVQRHRDISDPLADREKTKLSVKGTPLTPKFAKSNLKRAIKGSLGKHGPVSVLPEEEQLTIEPAQASTQVIKQGTKTLGQVSNPQLAATIKQAIGKGEMSLAGSELGEADYSAKAARAGKDIGKPGKQFAKIAKSAGEKYGSKERGEKVAGAVLAKLRKTNEADMPPNDALASPLTLESNQGVAEAKNHMGETEYNTYAGWKSACRKAGADKFEGDRDICQAMKDGKGMGEWDGEKGSVYDDSHKKKKMAEGKKPDFLDLDKDGNKKESMKKAADDKKKKMAEGKRLRESKETSIKAAHHRGKAHALAREGYNCRYDEGTEEARMYHEGYKGGLDECYGLMPLRGVVGEESEQDIVDNMASFGAVDEEYGMMEDDMEEGNAFTAALAKTPPGGKFSVGGKTFTDRSTYDSSIDEETMMAFESWDKQLNSLITEGEQVEEGMSISVSKGQVGAPDSVSVTASDSDTDKLMALVRQMGILGDEAPSSDYGSSSTDSVQQHGDLTVVDDHDGMMALIKKVSGPDMGSSMDSHSGSEDYADEESHGHEEGHDGEETCNECGGMMEAGHSCGQEVMGEEESEDEMEFEVSEDNAPDSDEAETSADENAEAAEDEALAVKSISEEDEEEDKEEEDGLEESFANSADDTFEADMDFMTRVISGGLNKQKSTGQATTPVVASQMSRLGNPMSESNDLLSDWKKLSGIK